jgi:hypothetical protein
MAAILPRRTSSIGLMMLASDDIRYPSSLAELVRRSRRLLPSIVLLLKPPAGGCVNLQVTELIVSPLG